MEKKSELTPWSAPEEVDYDRLIKEFGIKKMTNLPKEFMENMLFRRGTIFAHRDFGLIIEAIKNKKPFVMMTGLMPTGELHIGHLMLIKQMVFYQKMGAKIYIAVADLEAYNARQKPLTELREVAIEQYLTNYIAAGLDLSKCEVYFQSARSNDAKKSNAYYRLASNFSRYATFNEFKGVYGELSPGKMDASLLQASDMYHAQLPEFEGKPVPTFIPVGIDQDPHIRIARDMARRNKDHSFVPIASTYHIFMPGLQGAKGKMSSSNPNSYIALTDSPADVKKKINKYAFSGGQVTVEEHRKKGGNPDADVSFQYLKFLFEEDDAKLKDIEKKYRSGEMLTGELKKYTIEKINAFLAEHQKRRKDAKKKIPAFLLKV